VASEDFEAEDSAGTPNGNILFDKNTGYVTLKDQPHFVYVPINNVSIAITLCSCEVRSCDGQYFVNGTGEIGYKDDLVGVIGSKQFVSEDIQVSIYPESFLKERNQNLSEDRKDESRSTLGFSTALEADIYQRGSPASWFAIAYVTEEGIGQLVEAARNQFLNGVVVTLTLSKNIYRRQWLEKAKGIADSVDRTFRDEFDVLLYLSPSPQPWGYSSAPDVATGLSASINTMECAINFKNKTDDTTASENTLAKELEVLRMRIRRLETTLRWTAIIGFIYALTIAIWR